MEISFTPVEHPVSKKMACTSNEIFNNGTVKANPSGCVMPSSYKDSYKRILDFEVREEDVWILTFPRSGSAWTREMIWLLMNDLNFEKAMGEGIQYRAPLIDLSHLSLKLDGFPIWEEYLDTQPSPRCINSHLPKELLPRQLWTKKPKIVYVARNVKDVIVSTFFIYKAYSGYTISLEEFSELFLEDYFLFCPYWKNVLDFWNMEEPNILFNTYEEMKKDLPGVKRRTAKFLNKTYTDEQLSLLEEHLTFERMKENPSVNFEKMAEPFKEKNKTDSKYMRRGESGAWRRELPEDLAAKIDAWSHAHLRDSDYPHYE